MPPRKNKNKNKKRSNKKTPAVALVKAVAKKVVADALEDKYVTVSMNSSGSPTYFNAPIASNAEIYPVLPQISQGTNSDNRVGDRIRPKRLRVDFVITVNGAYNSSQLNQVRLFVLQDKAIKNVLALKDIPLTQTGTPIANQLIDYGGSVGQFTGVPDVIMRRVNKQRYQVYKDRTIELIAGTGQTPQVINGYNGTQTFVSGQQCFKLSCVIPTPATLIYSAAADTYPSNFAPFMCLGYVQPDGNAFPDNILQRVAVNFVAHLDYEDA